MLLIKNIICSNLAWFTETIPTVKNAWTENIKQNKIGEFIEKQKLHFPQSKEISTKTEYHSQTRGFIINEIFRRLDPKVRTNKEYFYKFDML